VNLRSAGATALIGSLVLLLTAALGWVLLLGPTLARVGEQREAAEAAADRSALLALQLGRLQAKAEDLGDTERAERRLAELFPPTADQPGFFEQIGEIAREAGYAPGDITTLSPSAPAPLAAPAPPPSPTEDGSAAEAAPAGVPSDLAVQTVAMTLEGGYDEARRMLRGLERLDRAFLVRSVALSASGDSSSLTMSISGATYVAPPVPAPATDETSQAG
jgi:Tfp pilus assembly protein PilO